MLSAGSYRGRMGNRVYAHQTGGSMTGRAMRHSMQGQIMGGLGMHMGGMRMGTALGSSAWTPGPSATPTPDISLLMQRSPLSGLGQGRAWRLGAYEQWKTFGPEPMYVPPVPILSGYGPYQRGGSGRSVTLGRIAIGGLAALSLALLG
jgi:hypothetical protein